jgi:hypothetical protein
MQIAVHASGNRLQKQLLQSGSVESPNAIPTRQRRLPGLRQERCVAARLHYWPVQLPERNNVAFTPQNHQ